MRYVPRGAPFADRGGWARGVLDLVAGRYPPFLFGLGVGHVLPVFHFHQTTPDLFDRACRYLAENRYRTVDSAELSALVRHGRRLPDRTVMLAFDDGLASLWTVVGPVLRRYGLRAVTYAIPARIGEAPAVRPTLETGALRPEDLDSAEDPFVTWPELQALSSSGLIDVQSHTWSHSMIFSGDRPIDVVRPSAVREDPLARPRINVDDPPIFVSPDRLGWPLFARQSRMSEARRFLPDIEACVALERLVSTKGGAAFFGTGWRDDLQQRLAAIGGRWESDDERGAAIQHELTAARETLEYRLGTRVRHVCLPWGVTSTLTRTLLDRLGFETAFANRFAGMFAVRSGDDPFFLKRLSNRHIFALPGRGRRPFLTFA